MDQNGTREIEEAVQKALAAAAIAGTVGLSGRTLTLRAGGAAPVEIDAQYLVEQWALLPADLRERKAADVAARLADSHHAAKAGTLASAASPAVVARFVPRAQPTGVAARGPRKPTVVPIGALIVAAAAAVLGWSWFKGRTPGGDGGAAAIPSASASAATESKEQRDTRVCEVARKRVLESGSLAQLDAQVWLAELWLATSKPGEDMTRTPALLALVDQGKLTPAADPDLAALREARVEIVGDEGSPRGGSGSSWRGMHVRFRGGYVSAFFEKDGRDKLNAVAARLADATSAEMGALYGRCAHLRYHDIGAWFRGATPAQAAVALVYSMGFFSERPLTNHDPNAPPTGADLTLLTHAFARVDRPALQAAVSAPGGTIAARAKDAPTVITFPLFGPTRAAQASRSLVESAGMGVGAPRPAGSH